MRKSPDLSFVAPDRREEVLRRINAIEDFLQIHGRKSAEAHAAELGLRIAQFYNLVKAWKATRRPERIATAEHKRKRDLGVSTEQAEIMDRIIAADPRAAPAHTVHAIMRDGFENGWSLPRQEIVTRYVGRVRPPLPD
jgi:hypothetical protein